MSIGLLSQMPIVGAADFMAAGHGDPVQVMEKALAGAYRPEGSEKGQQPPKTWQNPRPWEQVLATKNKLFRVQQALCALGAYRPTFIDPYLNPSKLPRNKGEKVHQYLSRVRGEITDVLEIESFAEFDPKQAEIIFHKNGDDYDGWQEELDYYLRILEESILAEAWKDEKYRACMNYYNQGLAGQNALRQLVRQIFGVRCGDYAHAAIYHGVDIALWKPDANELPAYVLGLANLVLRIQEDGLRASLHVGHPVMDHNIRPIFASPKIQGAYGVVFFAPRPGLIGYQPGEFDSDNEVALYTPHMPEFRGPEGLRIYLKAPGIIASEISEDAARNRYTLISLGLKAFFDRYNIPYEWVDFDAAQKLNLRVG